MLSCKTNLVALSAAVALTFGTSAFAADDMGTNAQSDMSSAMHHTKDAAQKMMGMKHDADNGVLEQLKSWKDSPDKAPDNLFALQAGCGNLWEIAFAKLVAEKGQDQQVKDTASMIERDHTAAEQKLEPIAKKMGVTIPQALPADKEAMLEIFKSLPADKLDNCFISIMRSAHLGAVNTYLDESKSAQDPDLKNYAAEALPTLRHHTNALIKVAETKGMSTDLNFDASMSPTDKVNDTGHGMQKTPANGLGDRGTGDAGMGANPGMAK